MDGKSRDVCRLCLGVSSLLDIFCVPDLDRLIVSLLNISVVRSDKHPTKLCQECFTTLCNFRIYRERCLEVQHILSNLSEVSSQHVAASCQNIDKNNGESTPSTHSASKVDEQSIPTSSGKRFKAIVTTSTGKKCYIYDRKQTYRQQLVECDICHKSVSKTRMEGHRNLHLGLRPLKCERGCEQSFHCKQLLLHHYRNVHSGETLRCDVCGKVLRSKRSLGYHKKDSHGERKHPCSFCDQMFVSNARLNQHLKYHRGERKYPCELCEYSFFSNNDLKKHLDSHDKCKPGRVLNLVSKNGP